MICTVRVCLIVLALSIGVVWSGGAQPFERQIAPFPVVDTSGAALDLPFLGGFNVPRPQFADIDADGDLDLFVQEESGRLMYFENGGTPQQARYVWRTDAYAGLDVGEWARLADLDGDGDLDVLAEQPFSLMRVYRNDGPPADPTFTLAADTLRATSGTPLFSDRQNVPALHDLDCDGDLDLFFATLAGRLVFYEHQGVDAEGVPRYQFVSDTYQDLEIVGDVGGKTLHGANAITFADVNADGRADLIWGDFFSPSLYFIENTGTCTAPALELRTDQFPESAPLSTSGYNVPRFADIDADGDLDLFVGVLGGAFGAAGNVADNFFFYERTPDGYALRTRRYLSQIDVGDESVPALGDVDGDGDLDLIVGTKIDPTEPVRARLTLFENTGTPEAPRFQRTPPPVADLDGLFNAAPALGDVDGDGDPDLLVGDFNGRVLLYRNEDGGAFPFVRTDEVLADLPRGSLAVPALADLDADGDLDLLVGSSTGAVAYFRNDGAPSEPDFTLVDEMFASIDVESRSAPATTDLDADGDLDLVVGSEREGVVVYRNVGTPSAPDYVRDEAALVPGLVPRAVTPTFADVVGSGTDALIAGTIGGGLVYYARRDVDNAAERPADHPRRLALTNHPNPFAATTTLRFTLDRSAAVRLVIYDLLGRRVRTLISERLPAGTHTTTLEAEVLPSGVYVARLTTSAGERAARLLTVRR